MAKDPAFLFYPNDWLGGTMGMTFEQKGAYMELLMLQFNRGHMTIDMIGQAVGLNWDEIKDKFQMDGEGKWYNPRLEMEQTKRKAYTASRVKNKTGRNQHTKDVGHMTSHMENEDNCISIKEVKLEKNGKSKLSGNFKSQGEESFCLRVAEGIKKFNGG